MVVRNLTVVLGERLRALTRHVPWEEDETLVACLREFFAVPDEPMSEQLEVDHLLVEAMQYFREEQPLRYQRLRRQILNYRELLNSLGIRQADLSRRYRLWMSLRYLVPKLLFAILGFPLFAYGALNHWLPYKIPGWLSASGRRDRVEVASVKFFTGLVTFPLFYALQGYLVARAFGWDSALLYLLSLLPSGLFALYYGEVFLGFFEEVRVFTFHVLNRDRVGRLSERRDRLLSELVRCRHEYQAAISSL